MPPKLLEGEYTKAGMMKRAKEDPNATWYKHINKPVYKYQLNIFGGAYRDQGGDFKVFQPLGRTVGANYEGIKALSDPDSFMFDPGYRKRKASPKKRTTTKRKAATKKKTTTKRKAGTYGIKVKGHMRSGYRVRGHLRHCKKY
tara:strand:- start:906 stop:1334 length:429 start_codon:yes stop_codon:yes gene_type:complete